MTTLYSDDFESYELNAVPSGWIGIFRASDDANIVVSGAKGVSGAGQNNLLIDKYSGIAARTQVIYQIKQKAQFHSGNLLLQAIGHSDNGDWSDSNNTYKINTPIASATSVQLSLSTRKNGGEWNENVQTNSRSWSVATGNTIVHKLQIDGMSVKYWVWNETNESQPATPLIDYTDSTQMVAGWMSVLYNNGNAVATGFDDVLITDLDGPSGGDTAAPTLTSPTASATGATTASGSVSTNEANGTLYYLASANATESVATVKAGSSQAVSASGVQNVTVTGLTASTSYYLHFVHTDAAANDSAVKTSAQFTTSAAGDATVPTLTGAVTFASVTQTSYTAQWPAGSDNVAVTGYEYQIGSTAGAWTNAGNNLSAAITGRTAGTTETVYVRAYDAAGLRSTPAISGSVTLLAANPAGTITVGSALYPIKYSSASVLNESGLRATVLDATTLAQVLNTSGVVCTNGVIVITDAALVIGNTYHLAVKTANGWLGVSDGVTAS